MISSFDLLTIGTLVLLEGILSVDNALVLAILVKPLPPALRKKALTYGIAGAIGFRILALFLAAYLLKFTILKFFGGAYLIYIALKHMFLGTAEEAKQAKELNGANFWKIIALVEFTDIVFSIDSITTAIAFSNKLWVLWVGGIAGIIAMRFTSSAFVKILEKYPRTEDLAYQLVFFVGTKLALEVFGVHLEKGVFWLMMGVIATIGISLVYRENRLKKLSERKEPETE